MSIPKPPPLEAAWQTLRSSLEWAEEFGLVFVFCSDARAKQALFQRANDLMRAQVRPFQRPEARYSSELIKRLLPLAINPASVHVEMGMPLWLDLDAHPGDSNWDRARRDFLHRLNERRATLAREHTRTVVLALPLEWTKQAAEAAPDLWTIRQPTVYLDTQNQAQPLPAASDSPPETMPRHVGNGHLTAAVLRWQANRASGQAPLSLWDATQASEAALASGQSELAWQIAQETAKQARALIDEFGKTPQGLRDLSVSMNKLGEVAQALGRLDEAQQAYRESEKLDRALIEDFGKTPQGLRDLSISMEKLGDIALALGRLDEAQQAFRESEILRRALIDDFGKTPQGLRDLSVSMGKLGDVALALGRLDEAQQAYRESEKLYRALIGDFGKTPQRLRDLSISMERLGDVALALRRLDEAQHAFRESEKLGRALIDDFGKTPQGLRDLLVSMGKLGDVALALGQLGEAQQAYAGEVELAKELITHFGETVVALEVLAYGEMRLGQTLDQQDKSPEAQIHHVQAQRLYQRLALAMPHDQRYEAALKELRAKAKTPPTGNNKP